MQEKRFGDKGQPNAEEKALGRCQNCPSFYFRSKTEKERHQGMFHRRQTAVRKEIQFLYCQFKGCGKSFSSQPSLSCHQTAEKHGAMDQPQNTETSEPEASKAKKPPIFNNRHV